MKYFKYFMMANWMIWIVWGIINLFLLGIPMLFLFGYCVEHPSWWLIMINAYSFIGLAITAYDDKGGRDDWGDIESWIFDKRPR